MLDSTRMVSLENSPLFQGLGRRRVREILRTGTCQHVDVGRVLLREGAPAAEAFIVLSGQAEVSLRGRTIARVGEGEVLGELALMVRGRGLRSATVTSVTPMELLVFNPREFATLMDRHAAVARAITNVRTGRLRQADRAA